MSALAIKQWLKDIARKIYGIDNTVDNFKEVSSESVPVEETYWVSYTILIVTGVVSSTGTGI